MFRYLFLLLFPCTLFARGNYDIIIRNGKIIDGTGKSWYYSDIAIREGKIDVTLANRIFNKSNQTSKNPTSDILSFIIHPNE